MSETIRIYSSGKRARTSQSSGGSRFPVGLFVLLLLFVVPSALYLYWISRDTRDVEEFLPAGAALEFVLNEPLVARNRLSDSFLWTLLPDDHPTQAVPEGLRTPLELPPWVERNWFPSYCYVSADMGENSIENVLLVTRISRVGVAIERAYRFRSAVEPADVEGLSIHIWRPHDLYYAVRGRILLASPDLRTLITALTLTVDERVEPGEIAGLFTQTGNEIRGRYRCPDNSELGEYVRTFSFALEEDAQSIAIQLQAALNPAFKNRIATLLGNAPPAALPPTPEGMIRVAADFGLPTQKLIPALGELIEAPLLSQSNWNAWQSRPDGSFANVLTAAFHNAGPQFALAWRGFDLDEMIPAPILVAVAQRGAQSPTPVALISESGATEVVSENRCPLPQAYAAGPDGRIYIPSVSGPALESVIQANGQWLRYTTDRNNAEAFFAEPLTPNESPGQGHLFAAVQPNAIIDTLAETGTFLAENYMLAEHDAESWHAEVQTWRDHWSPVEAMSALIAQEEDLLRAEIRIDFATPKSAD